MQENISNNPIHSKSIMWKYYEKLHTRKYKCVNEISKILQNYNLPNIFQKPPGNQNNFLSIKEIKYIIKKFYNEENCQVKLFY